MIDIEHAVVCTTIASADYGEVISQGIKPDFFTDMSHRRVFELIGEHLLEHRKVPSEEVISRAFPHYHFYEYPEPVGYYAKELRSRFIQRTLMTGLTEKVQPLLNDPEISGFELRDVLGQVLFDADIAAPHGAPIDVMGYIGAYLQEELVLRQKMGYLRGISTGFDGLDRATGGWQPQQLVTFVGLPKHGKSTFMLASALEAKRQGYKILFVTFEMSVDEQMDRLASLITNSDLNKILEGRLVHHEKEELFRAIRRHEVLTGFHMVHDRSSMLTLAGVNQTILDNEPDVVYVDGVYMMDFPGEAPMSPQALTGITRGMKRLAQSHKLPIVISTQALLSRSRGGLNVGSIGYSSSFLQDSDIVVGVERKTPTISEFKAMAVRSGQNTTCYINIDWYHGSIEEIDPAVALAAMEHAPSASTSSKGGWHGSSGSP